MIVSPTRSHRGGERMGQRKKYSAAFKAKVALEAIRGDKTVNELAGLYQVHPCQVVAWRKRLEEEMPRLFQDGRGKRPEDGEALQAQLYQQIGQLKVELDFLKKKTGMLG
jgi:transposase-like protein